MCTFSVNPLTVYQITGKNFRNISSRLASLIVSSVIAVFFISKMILSAAQSGGSISIAFILLVLGAAALLPGGVIGNGFRARKLSYAATDRRLIIISKSNFNSMFYRCIHDAAFMRDSDGKVSLLFLNKQVFTTLRS